MKEREGEGLAWPEELQLNLKRVYISLPKKSAVGNPIDDCFTQSSEDETKYFDKLAEDRKRRSNSELIKRQKKLLKKLIKNGFKIN